MGTKDTNMLDSRLQPTVAALLADGKGVLAADESLPTIERRFSALGISCTAESRRAYREMLFTTPWLSDRISGVILFEETLRQQTEKGLSFPGLLVKQGMVPGIKVDRGTTALAAFAGEKVTEGLEGLRERLVEYRELGARFSKWRAVTVIGGRVPTRTGMETNARGLAQFAALSQEAGLVPIVEPEVLMEGRHDLDRCEEVTTVLLRCVFDALSDHRVALEGVLLKTGMVLSGKDCPRQADAGRVAVATLRCLRRAVPAAVPGILFLSGGQSDVKATERLGAICGVGGVPWALSFSFGRGLQDAPLKRWKGSAANVTEVQTALRQCAEGNGRALQGGQ